MNDSKICDFMMVIWSDEILKWADGLEGEKPVLAEIGLTNLKISGIEDSQSIGWYEIRFDYTKLTTINVDYLKANLPKGQMVMLQEETHTGNSYPINSVFLDVNGNLILKCDDPESEYWEELEKWKIREDNIKINQIL